jgi:hypothetical protein
MATEPIFIQTAAGLGNAEIRFSIPGSGANSGKFWNFITLVWVTPITSDCKIFAAEHDSDGTESVYRADVVIPTSGDYPFLIYCHRESIGKFEGVIEIPDPVSTAANLATLAAKFTGITSIGNWIRAMLRKDTADSTALSEINSGGGSYDETVHSQQAEADQGALILSGLANLGSINQVSTSLRDMVQVASGDSWLEVEIFLKDIDGNKFDPADITNPGGGSRAYNGVGAEFEDETGAMIVMYDDAHSPLSTVALCHHTSETNKPQIIPRISEGYYRFRVNRTATGNALPLGQLRMNVGFFNIVQVDASYGATHITDTTPTSHLEQSFVINVNESLGIQGLVDQVTGVQSSINDLHDFDPATDEVKLISAYDAAKTAASQTSVNAIPTNPITSLSGIATATNVSNAQTAIIAAMPSVSGLATDAHVLAIPTTPLLAGNYTVPPTVTQIRQEMDSNSTKLAGAATESNLNTKIPTPLSFTGSYVQAQVKGQDNIDFGALQKASLNAATPSVSAALTSGNIADIIAGVNSGISGAYQTTAIIYVTSTTTPIPDYYLSIYDSTNTVFLGKATTSSSGIVTLNLDAGTYKVRGRKVGYVAANATETLIVAADGTAIFYAAAHTITAPSAADACRIYEWITNPDGVTLPATIKATAQIVSLPYSYQGRLIAGTVANGTYNSATGLLYWDIVKGALVDFQIPSFGIAKKRTISTDATKRLTDM